MTYDYQIGDGGHALDQQQQLDWLRGYQVVNAASGSNLLTAGTGDFDVDAASGDINFGGSTISCSAQTVDLSGIVDPDNPRKVTVYRDLNGDLAYSAGVAEPAQDTGESRRDAYRPAPPPLETTDAVVLGTVWVAAGATSIVDADIRDRRLPAEANVETLTADSGTVDSLSGTDLQYGSGKFTNETFIRPIRSNATASTSSDTYINLFDSESKDVRGEFDSNAEFSPDTDGEYDFVIFPDIRGNTVKGDAIAFRLFDSNDSTIKILGKENATGGNNEGTITGTVKLSSSKSYKFVVTNENRSFTVDTATTGVIRWSAVQ